MGDRVEVNGCWCGSEATDAFAPEYRRCRACGTLIWSRSFDPDNYRSGDGDEVFYGPRYWNQYVPDVLGLPGLQERADSDLSRRAIRYLERLLSFVPPGRRVLELGCAPGAFAYLLREAGFEVTGIELGAEIVEFVRSRFGLDVHAGPLEDCRLEGTFDAIVMIDVLEHLPNPGTTLAACAERLDEGGVLVIQTPCHRGEGADWPMLLPEEHLFLYTESSIKTLLETTGFQTVEISSSLFPHDMWVIAATGPAPARREQPLAGVAPIARAMIELDRRLRDAQQHHEQAADELRTAHENGARKEETIAALSREIEELRADQTAKSSLIETSDRELASLRADQQEKESLIRDLSHEIETLRADQADKDALILSLTREIDALRADQTEKQALIAALTAEIDALRADQIEKQALIVALSGEIADVRADQSGKQRLLEDVSEELAAVRADQMAKEELIGRISRELEDERAAGVDGDPADPEESPLH